MNRITLTDKDRAGVTITSPNGNVINLDEKRQALQDKNDTTNQ